MACQNMWPMYLTLEVGVRHVCLKTHVYFKTEWDIQQGSVYLVFVNDTKGSAYAPFLGHSVTPTFLSRNILFTVTYTLSTNEQKLIVES